MSGDPLIVRGMWGLGDNLFQRGFLRGLARRRELYLETPWPELYSDLPIRFVRGSRRLRTQQKNMERAPADLWSSVPPAAPEIRVRYGSRELERGSMIEGMEAALPLAPGETYFLDVPAAILERAAALELAERPIAIVRPVTVRREWLNPARNPLPGYVADIAAELMASHHVIAVADLEDGAEHALEPLPPFHEAYLAGELDVVALLALAARADVLVGGVGWIVPAALALGVRAFIVLGGHGGHNAPAKITDPRLDLTRVGFAMPDRFCLCSHMRHASCDKTISNLSSQWSSFLNRTRAFLPSSPRII